MENSGPSVEWVNIDTLKPYLGNPRKNDHAVKFVVKSLERFGFKNPILTDKDLRVCAGHTRLKAAKKLGLKKVPIIRNIDPSEFEMYNIADNQTALLADWDEVLLAERLKEIQKEDENFLTDIGFNDWDADDIINKDEEYKEMPEFELEDKSGKQITIHFVSDEDIEEFYAPFGEWKGLVMSLDMTKDHLVKTKQ